MSSNISEFESIKNRGPLVLSDTNPYLAPNLFLSKEAQKYPDLLGFIKHRGTPTVIELHSGAFNDPELLLYYPAEREHFVLKKSNNNWDIFGPQRTPGSLIAKIKHLAREIKKPASLLVTQNLQNEQKEQVSNLQNLPKEKTLAMMSLEEHRNDKLVLAKKNERGDILHIVKFKNETLDIISLWYTYEYSNKKRIAAINMLDEKQELKLHQEILIPAYMVKYERVLPESLSK